MVGVRVTFCPNWVTMESDFRFVSKRLRIPERIDRQIFNLTLLLFSLEFSQELALVWTSGVWNVFFPCTCSCNVQKFTLDLFSQSGLHCRVYGAADVLFSKIFEGKYLTCVLLSWLENAFSSQPEYSNFDKQKVLKHFFCKQALANEQILLQQAFSNGYKVARKNWVFPMSAQQFIVTNHLVERFCFIHLNFLNKKVYILVMVISNTDNPKSKINPRRKKV